VTPGAVDRRIVRRHLMALREAVSILRRHAGRPLATLHDAEERWTVERGLELAAQNVLDVATHLVAAAGKDAPDYASAVDALADLRVLPAEFTQRLRGLAGFRNVLVHGYLEVDPAILRRQLDHGLDDLLIFADRVEEFLQRLEE
jgi:uncharacterized protein YutE (UPF0331/DUF86 family)